MGINDDEVKDEVTNDKELIYKYNREVFYHFDKEKGFTQQVGYQNPNNQIIIKQSWDAAEQRLEEVKQQVLLGKASPVAYYMEKILMEVPMLAAYMEMPVWRVKRHLKSKVFRRLKPQILDKYASVFNITADELTRPDFLK